MSMSSTQNLVHLSIPKWRWQVKQKRSETLSQGNCQCCLGMENHTKKIKMVPFCKIRTSGCHSLCFLKIKKGEQQQKWFSGLFQSVLISFGPKPVAGPAGPDPQVLWPSTGAGISSIIIWSMVIWVPGVVVCWTSGTNSQQILCYGFLY